SQGIRAQLAARENEWWQTAKLGKEMKKSCEHILQTDPTYYPADYLLGSYNYFADVLPAHIKFIRTLLFLPGGDREKGLRELMTSYQKNNVVSAEAGRTLALIYIYYEKEYPEAVKICDNMLAQYPESY